MRAYLSGLTFFSFFLIFGIFVNLQMYATSACRKLNNIFMFVSLFSGIYNETLTYRCYMPQGATGFTNNKPNRLYKK